MIMEGERPIALTYALIFAATIATQPSCDFDATAMMALPFEQFDQDLNDGWRAIEGMGCSKAAAEVLRRYREEHQQLTDPQRSLLLWHEGQVLAFLGDHQRAVPLLLAGVPIDDKGEFTEYALGTVAFLRRDRQALLTARARLAALPKPDQWVDQTTAKINGNPVSFVTPWPPNLNVLDGLMECFDRPYKEAYTCRPLKKLKTGT